MLLATALALLITGCAQQTFTVQNKPAAVATEKPSPSFLRFWNWAEENIDAAVVAAQRSVVKTEAQQTFVNGLLGFITLGIYTPLEARGLIAHNNCMSFAPSIWATLSALLINMLLSSLPIVLHSDQPLSEG